MNTPFIPVAPPADPAPADPAYPPVEAAQSSHFDPAHPRMYVFQENAAVVDGLSIDPAPLPLLGTDASRDLG